LTAKSHHATLTLEKQSPVAHAELEAAFTVADSIQANVDVNVRCAECLQQSILKKVFSGNFVSTTNFQLGRRRDVNIKGELSFGIEPHDT